MTDHSAPELITCLGIVTSTDDGTCARIEGYRKVSPRISHDVLMMVGDPVSARKLAASLLKWADQHDSKNATGK